MAVSNRERIGKALESLQQGLKPYIVREMKAEYKNLWMRQASYSVKNLDEEDPHLDVQALLMIMWDQWKAVFQNSLGHSERSLVSELREVRNRWAHQKPFTTDDTYRALDSMTRLLEAISAPEAQKLNREKQELLRMRYEEQARRQVRRAASTQGNPSSGLQPWRHIIAPHPDVASGRYLQSEFAADLWQVYLGEGSDEYLDPQEFFSRTFLTDGLSHLLSDALKRLNGRGGHPVVELRTNFGGGKTHSMLALYHLFSGVDPSLLLGMEPILQEAGTPPDSVRRAVLVGNKISPGQPVHKEDGTVVRTLWGELAWQLGGPEGYQLLREADETATNPGDQLRLLFNRYAPCLILVDEWVSYARQLHETADLPGGSFDTHFTFAQTLTEAAKGADSTLLLVSLPASDIEVGGEKGRDALQRLQNAIGRVEATWRPASAEEGFEIVRRRLFQPLTDPSKSVARDTVVRAFSTLYQKESATFPSDCGEADYQRRMQAAYPIHPELFDRLYVDWSSLERFQRTRGVLRLMAAVIHTLWEREDANLLIMPSMIPIDDNSVQYELTRYLEDNWQPVITHDVDGPTSLPRRLDADNTDKGRYSAHRRVARTIYMGSAPIHRSRNPGQDKRRINLGCIQPGEPVTIFSGDALRRLTDTATYLYVNRDRYWYSTQPSVARLAQDRATQFANQDELEVWTELKQRLRNDRTRVQLPIHMAPDSHADVPDDPVARMVVIGPHAPHMRGGVLSPASQEAQVTLKNRGNSPRLHQNMLTFLAPDQARLQDLKQALCQFLAWRSIHEEEEILNLDAFQRNQAKTKYKEADTAVNSRITETYIWLLVPTQSDARDHDTLILDDMRLIDKGKLIEQASTRLIQSEELILTLSGHRLRMEIDDNDLWQGNEHIPIKQLWEYFARYPYLPRLQDERVLLAAIEQEISQTTWKDNFAFAKGWDEKEKRYEGLVVAGEKTPITIDDAALLVHPQAAQRQLEKDKPKVIHDGPGGNGGEMGGNGGETGGKRIIDPPPLPPPPLPPPPPPPRHFHGRVQLDPLLVSSEAGEIAELVVKHLAGFDGCDVTVTLEIEASKPDGMPDKLVRTVSENARTLHFHVSDFEEE